MDIATVLEEYLADISSLPGDLAFILDELKAKDIKLVDAQRRIQQKDGEIQKFIKSNGAMQEYPKEQAFYPRIRSDFQDCITLQQEKVKLAIMGLYLVTKHVSKLNSQVAQLEAEGQLPPVLADTEESFLDVSMSPEPQTKPRKSINDASSRRVSRLDPKERTASHSEGRLGSHSRSGSRAASASPAPSSLARSANGSGSSALAQPGGSGGSANKGSGGIPSESERDAVEVNGARVSLKRSHTSPRQRPPGLKERDEAFCYCKKGSVGNMIACDSDSCQIEWFHWDCVGLTEDPKGSWYCPECREKVKKQAK